MYVNVLSVLLCALLSQTAEGAPPQPAPAGEDDLSAVEQLVKRIHDDNAALARRVQADARVLKAVRQAEVSLGEDSASGAARAVQALEALEEITAHASPETVTVVQQARTLVEAARQSHARPSVRESFHHVVTDRMLEIVRGNNVTLFDRLLHLRALQDRVDTAVEHLERATFEELRASAPF